jgi:hypothetical protein
LEAGSEVTSPILTTNAIATRVADIAYVSAEETATATMQAEGDVADVLTADENQAASMAASAATTEDVNATDTPNRTMAATAAQADAASAAESANRTMSAAADRDEPASADEIADRDLTAPVAQVEDVNATDTQNRTMAAFPDQDEAAIADDAPGVELMYAHRLQSDDATADDTQVVLAVSDMDEATSATDTQNRVVDIDRAQDEAGAADDNLTVIAVQDQEDEGNAQDSPSAAGQASVDRDEPTTAADTSNRVMTAPVDGDESASAAEVHSVIAVQDQEDDGAAIDTPDKAMAATVDKAEVHGFRALSFDGVDDYATTGTSAVAGPYMGPVTIMARFRTTDNRAQRCIIANTGSAPGFRFGHTNGSVYYLVGENGGTNYSEGTIGTAGKVNDGEWHHVALRIIPATAPGNGVLEAVVDGVDFGTKTHSATYISAANGYISFGRMGTGTSWATADMCDARIYDRLLTTPEIADIANDVAPDLTDILGWWPMDELPGSGSTIYDASGNGRHATMASGEGSGTAPARILVNYIKDVPAAIGQSSASLSDAVTASETSNRVLGAALSQVESAPADDTSAIELMYASRVQADDAAADDTVITIAVQTQTDATPIFEESDRDVSMLLSQADAASADEAATTVAVQDQEDEGAADDAPNASGSSVVARAEPTAASDATASTASASVDSEEDTNASDASALDLVGTGSQSEPAFADEQAIANMYSQGDQSDDADADDTAISLTVADVERLEPTTASETSNRTMSTASAQTDATTATDAPVLQLMYAGREQEDNASADDTAIHLMVADANVSDYGNDATEPGLYPQYNAGHLLAFERLSGAAYFDGAGNLQTVAAGAARFTPGGLLIEDEATNVLRNNSMTGAAAGSPGTLPTNWQGTLGTVNGLTFRISDVTTENGIPCFDLEVSGTASANFTAFFNTDNLANTPATAGETWTSSVFSKKISGNIPTATVTTSGRNSLVQDSDNTSVPLNQGTGALSSQRVIATRVMSNAATVSVGQYLAFPFASGQLYIFT